MTVAPGASVLSAAGRTPDLHPTAFVAAGARVVGGVTLAEGAIANDAGQARLSNPVVRAQRGDLAVSGSVNLAEAAIDARLTLFGSGGAGAPADTRPEIGATTLAYFRLICAVAIAALAAATSAALACCAATAVA